MQTLTKIDYKTLAFRSRVLLSRISFWDFCQYTQPDFYKPSRTHLVELCDTLQNIYEGKLIDDSGNVYRKLIVEMPPQHGKTRTLVNFCKWVLGQEVSEKIITASYNDLTAMDFSKYTRDGIAEEKRDPYDIVYSDVFPETRLNPHDKSKQRWALSGQHFSYISAGIGGSLTSKGGTILIVDDPVKDAESALNDDHIKKIWRWYTNTFKTRISAEGGLPIEIIVMTPWVKNDLSGRFENDGSWYKLSLPIIDISYEQVMSELKTEKKSGQMLCKEIFSREALDEKLSLPDTISEIDQANYFMQRLDIAGRLYSGFKTYDELPKNSFNELLFERLENYTDTADEGDDFLCSINYGVYNGLAYILDVLYTDEPMEITEPKTANMLKENGVGLARIESNSGGRGFARAIKKELEKLEIRSCAIKWFHQSKNKQARILTNSAAVQERVLFPKDWQYRWPTFYKAVVDYQKKGKKQKDDVPDVLTGIVENLGKSIIWGN